LGHTQTVAEKYYHFKGKIADKFPIEMGIYLSDNKVEGYYYYKKIKRVIKLKGKYNPNGTLKLTEYIDYLPNAYFIGKVYKNTFVGKWITTDKTKKYPFKLYRTKRLKIKRYKNTLRYTYAKHYRPQRHIPYGLDIKINFKVPIKYQKVVLKMFDDTNLKFDEYFEKKIDDAIYDYLYFYDDNPIMEPKDYSTVSYLEDWSLNKIYENKNFLINKYSSDYYGGGPHGTEHFKYQVIDKKSSQVFPFEKIINPKFKKKIHELELKKLYEMGIYNDLDNLDFEPSKNVYFDNENLYLFYNVYEIIAYAYGPVTIKFKFDEIKNYLTPEFKKKMNID